MSEEKPSTSTEAEMSPPTKKQKLEETCSEQSRQDGDFSTDVDIDEAPKSNTMESDKYTDHVTAEEVDRLREFHVLDEVTNEDSDNASSDSDKSEGVPEEEIERMLDEDLPDELKGAPKPKERPYITRQKVVLEEKGVNPFEVLPLDWVMVRHYSGMPVYIHRTTRVCTLAKPYFLGKGNTRRHDIPISAIPCFSYRRALEEEEKQKEIDKEIQEQIRDGTWKKNDSNTSENNDNSAKVSENNDNSAKVSQNNDNSVKISENNDNSAKVSENNDNSAKVSENNDNSAKVSENNDNSAKVSENNDKSVKVSQNNDSSVKVSQNIDNSVNKLESNDNVVNGLSNNKENNDMETNDLDNYFIDQCKEIENEIKSDQINKDKVSKCPFKHNINEIKIENNEIDQNNHVNDKAIDVKSDKSDSKSLETNEMTFQEADNNKIDENIETMKENGEDNQKGEENGEAGSQGSETANLKEKPLNRQPVVLPGGVVMPPPRVETVSTSWKSQHLAPEQVTNYCKALFRFKCVKIMHFKRWADRRKYTKARKTLQYPTLPEGTKLITIPAQPAKPGQENVGGRAQRDWVMNMNGRSYLSVFHEYVRRALQKQPVYQFKPLENAAQPYQATVFIGDMQYGVGRGSSKRAAKAAAARASIHILIPEMAQLNDEGPTSSEPDFSFFDYVGIEDPRITEFCAATCEPSPHAILRTCLLRNFGAGDRHIHTEMKKLEYQKVELTMKVGKHTATVVCKNKKSAKQRASQAILQALHPHVRSWGSLLRLYGSRSVKSCKEKKLEEQQITLLQDSARHNEPNYAVLEKLRNEMRKLRERDEAVVSIGTLIVKDDLPTHSGSNLNNVDL